MDSNSKLRDLYYNGFLSLNKLWKQAKEDIEGIKYKDVKDFLERQPTYQINKQSKKPKRYNTILANKVGNNFQIDIIIYDRYEIHKYKYILCCIDIHSRFAQCRAMTNRENDNIIKNLEDIFNVMDIPKNINCDLEFNTKKINKFFNDLDIVRHYSEVGELNRNSVVERFNRTIAGRIQKWRVATGKRDWTQVLNQLVDAYNNSYHRTIRAKPIDVFEGKDENKQSPIINIIPTFEIGDTVRIKQIKPLLGKGDFIKFSENTYLIDKKVGNKYKLKNIQTGKEEKKSYKDYELKKINEIETLPNEENEVYIEKVEMDRKKTERRVNRALKELRDYNKGGERTKILEKPLKK